MGVCPDVVPYPTPKYARIKDAKLGLLRYALYSLVFTYVFIYNVAYLGTHLGHGALEPVYQVQFTNPTKDHCDPKVPGCQQDFSSLASLPYCAQSSIPYVGHKLSCEMWETPKLNQVSNLGLVIPTHVVLYQQGQGCQPSAHNNYSCDGFLMDYLDDKGNVQKNRGDAKPIKDIYTADIDRSTFLIDHSVDSTFGFRSYATDMQGYWMDCSHGPCKPKPIMCGGGKRCNIQTSHLDASSLNPTDGARGARRSLTLLDKRIPKSFLAPAAEAGSLGQVDVQSVPQTPKSLAKKLDKDGVISDTYGDIFMVSKLLDMANMTLDERRPHFREDDFPPGVSASYRSSGFILVVRVFYTNDESWIGLKVFPWDKWGPNIHYIYSITKHASDDDYVLSKMHVLNQTSQERVVKNYHGIRVMVEQTGSITIWDNIQFIVITCYVLALVAASNFITDTVALHYMAKSPEYTAIKYQRPVANKRRKQEDYHDSDVEHPDSEPEDDNILRYSSMTM